MPVHLSQKNPNKTIMKNKISNDGQNQKSSTEIYDSRIFFFFTEVMMETDVHVAFISNCRQLILRLRRVGYWMVILLTMVATNSTPVTLPVDAIEAMVLTENSPGGPLLLNGLVLMAVVAFNVLGGATAGCVMVTKHNGTYTSNYTDTITKRYITQKSKSTDMQINTCTYSKRCNTTNVDQKPKTLFFAHHC